MLSIQSFGNTDYPIPSGILTARNGKFIAFGLSQGAMIGFQGRAAGPTGSETREVHGKDFRGDLREVAREDFHGIVWRSNIPIVWSETR